MSELRRILSDRRRLALLFCLPILCLGLYLLERMGGDVRSGTAYLKSEIAAYRENVPRFAAMSAAEAEADQSESYWFDGEGGSTLRSTKRHVSGYADYLDRVQTQARRMAASSVFGKNKNSFTYRNILKTASDFRMLNGIRVEFGGNRALETWISFRGGDVLFLLAILVLVLAFFEDKRCGLLPMVRACPRGRLSLIRSRLGILLLSSAVLTVLLCLLPLILALALYGGTETFGHTIQSVEGFRTCTLHLTVGQWIGFYLGAKVLCGFLLGLLIWFVLSFLSQMQLAWLVLLAILGVEYAAWTLIQPQLAISVFRYVNLFAYVFPAETLSAYGNMNFFGRPVGILTLLFWLYLLLTALLSAWVIFGSVKRRPLGNRNLLGRPIALWNRAFDLVRSRLPLLAMESYKLLILGGTALFLLAALWYAPKLRSFGYSFGSADDAAYNGYVHEAAGPINADTDAYLARARENLAAYYGDVSQYETALDRLEEETSILRARASDGGYTPWLAEEVRVNNVLGQDAWSVHRWSGIVSLFLVLLVCAPVFSFERRFGTEKLLRSVRKGRGPVLRRKIAVVCLEVLAIWAIVYLRQWNETLDYIGPASLDAPIQNIALLSRSSLRVTLKQFLILVFALRLLGMLTVGLLVSWLSSRAKGWEQAVLAGTGLLILPALLYYFDRAWAGNLSVLPILTGVEPLIPGPTQRGNMVRLLVWSAAAALLFGSACRSWRGKMKKI